MKEMHELKQVHVRLKLAEAEPLYSEEEITTPQKAAEVMADVFADLDREYCCVVNLDGKNRPINFNVVCIGDVNKAVVPVQNVFKSAILSNAASIMMLHNHPSGSLDVSREDYEITKRLVEAGKIMNIPVLDHIIMAGGDWCSLYEIQPLMFKEETKMKMSESIEKDNLADQNSMARSTFTIFQLKDEDFLRDYHFEGLERLHKKGLDVNRKNYNAVFESSLKPGMTLDDIYFQFNVQRPPDFIGHSLSVSDVIVLHQKEEGSGEMKDKAYYVDRYGFTELPEFLKEKAVERSEKSTREPENAFHPRRLSFSEAAAVRMAVKGKDVDMSEWDNTMFISSKIAEDLKAYDEQGIGVRTVLKNKIPELMTEKWSDFDINDVKEMICQVAASNQEEYAELKVYAEYGERFNEIQMEQVIKGVKSGLDVSLYARPEYNDGQMYQIRRGLETGLDVSLYAKPEYNFLQMSNIRQGLEKGLDVGVYAKPEFAFEKMDEIRQGLETGLDVSLYARPEYDWQQMSEIRTGLAAGLDVSLYARPEYNHSQMLEIHSGLEQGLDASVYAKPEYDWRQMSEIRQGLVEGLDVSVYAKPEYDGEQMNQIRRGLNSGRGILPAQTKPDHEIQKEPEGGGLDFDAFVKEHGKMLQEKIKGRTTVVINAFGGPGSGKTTSCLDICAQLKKEGYNAEYVQEVAKELVYDNRMDLLDGSEAHQFDMLKEQMKRMDRLIGQTDFIVTDSPILLNAVYNQELTSAYNDMVSQLHNQYSNFSFFMKRDEKEFQEEGRIHNLEQSRQKDREIKDMLKEREIFYGTYSHETIGVVVKNAVANFKNLSEKKEKHKAAGTKKHFYTREEAEKMTEWLKKNIRIVDAVEALGYTPVKVGQKYYTLKEHDSVRLDVTRNCFFWNSTGDKGSVLDALMAFGDMEKAEAFQYLYDMAGGKEAVYNDIYGEKESHMSNKEVTEKKKTAESPKAKTDLAEVLMKNYPENAVQRNVWAYLTKTRQIRREVVQDFFDRKMLYQDGKRNCVFVSREEGKPVFACVRGSNSERRFVADVKGSDYRKGFYIDNGADSLFVAESVIDAMSKMTMLQETGRDFHEMNYLCLAGCEKVEPLNRVLKNHPEITDVSVGTDNDAGGKKGLEKIKTICQDKDITLKTDMPLEEGQDWNGALCDYYRAKAEGREIKVCEEKELQKQKLPPRRGMFAMQQDILSQFVDYDRIKKPPAKGRGIPYGR